jgi:hypothetical protein
MNEVIEHQQTLAFDKRLFVLWNGFNNETTQLNFVYCGGSCNDALEIVCDGNDHTKTFYESVFICGKVST